MKATSILSSILNVVSFASTLFCYTVFDSFIMFLPLQSDESGRKSSGCGEQVAPRRCLSQGHHPPQHPSTSQNKGFPMQRFWIPIILVAIILLGSISSSVRAELTPEHRRELASLKKTVSRVGGLIRAKRVEEAEKILEEAEAKIDEIVKAAEIEKDDRSLRSLSSSMERYEVLLAKAKGETPADSGKVHFLEDVAPLIDSKCLGCHGATNPRAGLRLDTLTGWRRGGQSGPLLAPGNAGRSLLIARLTAPAGQGRMPQRGEPLSMEEIETVGKWINQGADVQRANPNTSLSDLIYEYEKKTMSIEIPKPKGTETVSFTRDMAPWMTNLCLGCHNSRNKSGGLSVETFYDLMKGGDTGLVILPGDKENSRFFRLVGGLELPRMPQGQARITRKNYEDMIKWFEEGNTFDGADARTNIRTYVRSAAEMAADEFRKKTDEEMLAHRMERTTSQLKRAVPNDPQNTHKTEHFLMAGNVDEARLQEVGGWAEEKLVELQKLFGGTGLPWRGQLAIFVLKDRFSYDEFNEVIEQRRADAKMHGHSKVTANHEDAYAVLQDLGDAESSELTTQKNLTEHLTGAFLKQNGSVLPSWLISGTGLIMATDARKDVKRVAEMKQAAASIVPTLQRPEDVFEEGTFSPGTVGPVGYTLVRHLIDSQGAPKFAQFVTQLQRGQNVEQSLTQVYGANSQQVARSYAASLSR